jgi:ribosomal protein L31E
MLGLDEQPGCAITGLETDSQIVSGLTKTEDVLKILAKYVSEHIGQQNIQVQTTENKQIEESSINSIPAQNSLSPESIKIDLDIINKKLDLNINLPIKVTSSDKEGILECEGYGSHWPYKVICEFELDNINSVNSVTATFVAKDQGWGGTGHCNVRYRVGSSKISPAFFIDREKTPSNTYTYIIKKDELEGLTSSDKITFWLCSAPWGGWSAQVTQCDIVIN